MLSLIPTRKRQLTTFDELFNDLWSLDKTFVNQKIGAPINVETDEKNVYVSAELPGMNKDEINVEYKDGYLTISGEKKSETKKDEKGYHYQEISYGKFARTVNVGDVSFEKGKADYKNGVLKIELPKAEETKPNRLLIK